MFLFFYELISEPINLLQGNRNERKGVKQAGDENVLKELLCQLLPRPQSRTMINKQGLRPTKI